MPRYRLRTLLILLAILPPLLWIGWGRYSAWRAEQERLAHTRLWMESGTQVRESLIAPIILDQPAPPRPKAPAKAGE